MTIQEAIKSGKPFKRPHHSCHYENFRELDRFLELQEEDLLATDWEIKKEPIEITIRSITRTEHGYVIDADFQTWPPLKFPMKVREVIE